MLEIEIGADAIRIGPRFAVTFQRTLRVPDDDRSHPLPPGFGPFPIRRVCDYADRVAAPWRETDGAFIPMYRREALWLGFAGAWWKPNAVKVAVGGINAITGEADDQVLHADPQDYLVCPEQPWLDGFKTGEGLVRQFVAMPLGFGYTVEQALTGAETVGGLQITVFEPKPGRFPDQPPTTSPSARAQRGLGSVGGAMGLGAGARIRQRIYRDRHGVDVWDPDAWGRVVVRLVDSARYREITGEEPPPTPIDARSYAAFGLPWFELYDEDRADVAASGQLADAATIGERDAELGLGAGVDDPFDVPATAIVRFDDRTPEPTVPGAQNGDGGPAESNSIPPAR